MNISDKVKHGTAINVLCHTYHDYYVLTGLHPTVFPSVAATGRVLATACQWHVLRTQHADEVYPQSPACQTGTTV